MAKKKIPTAEDNFKAGMIDLTKTGPLTYRELQSLNGSLPLESEENAQIQNLRPGSAAVLGRAGQINYTNNPDEDFGESVYDDELANQYEFENYQDLRGERQSGLMQVANGLAKGAVLAGTTFLDGTVGLVYGAATAISEGRWSGIWDNDFSRAMKAVNEWSEEAMPNYYTEEEQNSPWYTNIFTANFLGDKFIKNLGFSVGAIYSGSVWTKPLTLGGKLAQGIGMIAKSSKAPAMVNTAIGATISAVNEGRVEALNNSEDWYNNQKAQLDDIYRGIFTDIQNEYDATKGQTLIQQGPDGRSFADPAYIAYNEKVKKARNDYKAALAKLNEDRAKMGNADLLMNIPVLTASNVVPFTKFYANGYKTARKASNIIGRAGKYTAQKTKAGGIWSVTKGATAEGLEEISQSAASRIAGDYYQDDVTNFYKAKIDPDAEQETLSWMKSFAQGINETVNDGSAWEEFFIGTLTGALGIPSFKKKANGKLGFGMEGGAYNGYREYAEQMAREQEIANYMNNRVQSPESLNYYQGLIRHNKFQADMNDAVDRGDEFDFKNAEFAQMVSDIAMFDNAGRLNDLKTLIGASFDTSDENLDAIIRNTTTVQEDGQLVGPFAQYAQLEDGQVKSILTEDSKQEMIDKLTQNRDDMMSTIDEYVKIKDDIDIKTGQKLSDGQLEELTWMRAQLGDWAKRAESVSADVKSAIGHIIGNLSELVAFNDRIMAYEGQHNAGLTDAYKQADKMNQTLRNAISTLDQVRQTNDKYLAATLAQNPKFVKGLMDEIDELDDSVMGQESKEDIKAKLQDVVKLGNATNTYKAKLKEYLGNPNKMVEANNKATEDTAKKEAEKKVNNFREALGKATTLSDFRAAVETAESPEVREAALKEMEEQGSELAKNYRETQLYNSEVRRVLESQGENEQTTTDTLKLLQDQYDHSSNLEQIANLNSVFVTNENAFDEESINAEESAKRFLNAQYALQRAMSQVNNDMRFRDRFSAEYKRPVEKPDNIDKTKGTDRDKTGADGTSTVPSVNPSNPMPVTQPPVGNVTPEMVAAENAEVNRSLETPATLDRQQEGQGGGRKYYRPSIPQLHIEGSKEGDFRPFKDVVKEREQGVNFDAIYDHLESAGAFDYVNDGNLHEGDEIGFMIDPTFEEKVSGEPWHKAPTIFMVTSDGQIVGSLDDGVSVNRFEGLAGLQEKVRKEWDAQEDKSKRYVATPKTRVAKVMVGKVVYGQQEQSLSAIPGVMGGKEAPVFGIIKNGVLTTNNKVSDDQIIKPVDMSKKEGRLYLLIPNGAGKYSPVAVRVKHFNNEEFNLDDATISSTPMGRSINDAFTQLSQVSSQDDIAKAMESLAGDIYMQDVMLTWYDDARGTGITIGKKVRKDDGTYEMIDIKGEQHIKEDKIDIPFTKKGELNVGGIVWNADAAKANGAELPTTEVRTPDEIRKSLIDAIMGFNLPLQVSANRINTTGYNNRVINSGITTSNIVDTRTRGTWFTTDYFDSEGNLQRAISPASVKPTTGRAVETPVGGKDGVASGTPVTVGGVTSYVDLQNNTITANGKTRGLQASDKLFIALAWAQDTFGDATEAGIMTENKVILPETISPNGEVLDRTTGRFLSDEEAQKIKDKIAGRNQEQERRRAEAERTIAQIYENQKRVDKERTDGESYYVLEEDGEYHPYSRVHTVLGSNWVQSQKQKEALDSVQVKLQQLVDDPKQYDNYLQYLANKYHVNLDGYKGKTDIKSREAVVNSVRDAMSGTNSQRALNAGSAVDSVIRQYFITKDVSKIVKPDNMSESAYLDLLEKLRTIKENIKRPGERFLTDNIVLFYKYPDGTRVAGEVDILAVDKEGNFKIYDVKTSKYSFGEFTDRYGHKVNYFKNPSPTQRMSTEAYYTLQLSAYKNLFESQYGLPVTKLAVMPFVLSYDKETVSSITGERGIPITYNPSVGVPLAGSVKAPVAPKEDKGNNYPIFNSTVTGKPIEMTQDDADTAQGKFILDGKVVSGPITSMGTIADTEVFVTRVANMTRGFGKEEARVGNFDYYAVFPNGEAVKVSSNVGPNVSPAEVIEKMKAALEGNPQRVKDIAAKQNVLTENTPAPKVETASTIVEGQPSTLAQMTAEIQGPKNKRTAPRKRFRETDGQRPMWNQEQELAWLDKVLPQLSREERVRVSKGLIKVAERGARAWGAFDGAMMTISDIAAEGTTYHEAFHVVFDLLTDQKEREALYAEAKRKFGDKSLDELEEDMAEDFREYVMTQDKRGIGQKILDFFKNLFDKATNWKYVRPSLNAYYRGITQGRYVEDTLNPKPLETTRYSQEYTSEMKSIKENAIAKGTFMKAPNGNPTNLTERQWLQVRTKNFINWFGDWINDPANASKVVDENGEPLVVYHGSKEKFTIFNKNTNNRGSLTSIIKKGFYFSNKNIASQYASSKAKEDLFKYIEYEEGGFSFEEIAEAFGFNRYDDKELEKAATYIMSLEERTADFNNNLYAVFLNIKNPVEIDLNRKYIGALNKIQRNAINKSKGAIIKNVDETTSRYRGEITIPGMYVGTDYIVFEPNQIKSATDNIGTFDSSNPDIRYRRVDTRITNWDSVSEEQKEILSKKGWTEEKYNSVSQEERDQVLRCLHY